MVRDVLTTAEQKILIAPRKNNVVHLYNINKEVKDGDEICLISMMT